MAAGVGTATTIASLVADAGQWTTRLSREVRSVVRTSANLGDLFRQARTAIDDLAGTAEHDLAGLAGQPAMATAAAGCTHGTRGASRSAQGGGRGAGTGHNGGRGDSGPGTGTGSVKGHGGTGDSGLGDAVHISSQGLGDVVAQQHQGQLHLLPDPQAVALQALVRRLEHLRDARDRETCTESKRAVHGRRMGASHIPVCSPWAPRGVMGSGWGAMGTCPLRARRRTSYGGGHRTCCSRYRRSQS